MENKDVGHYFRCINDKLRVRADEDLKKYRLTLSQSRVFAFLKDSGGEATQKEIEVFLEVSHPTVVGLISRMEQNGYLSCRVDESDRRNKIVALTAKAREVGESLGQSMTDTEHRILQGLSEEEVKELKRMLEQIYRNLK